MLGLGNGEHARRTAKEPVACHQIEALLEQTPPLDAGCRAVWREHVGYARLSQMSRSDHTRQVATRMQMRDVEAMRGFSQVASEPERREELPAVRKSIRHIREHPPLDAFGAPVGWPGR